MSEHTTEEGLSLVVGVWVWCTPRLGRVFPVRVYMRERSLWIIGYSPDFGVVDRPIHELAEGGWALGDALPTPMSS